MSLSRVVYSDGGASGSPLFKRQSLERIAKGAPSQEERGGECAAVHLGFDLDNRNEDSDGWC